VITGSLNARRRERELEALAGGERVDLAVVGGGVTGAGIALDAASRGLSVALIEAHDLAFGTSRWSSKLVHGGLRYLAKGDLALAHESAVERGILMTRTAPHLTRAMPQLFPLYTSTSRTQQALIASVLATGDLLRRAAHTPSSVLPRPRIIPAAEALALAPGLDGTRLRGALLAYDGALTDDARLVVSLARTASAFGARILTRLRATGLAVDRVSCRDEISGQGIEINARQVINAAGVWAGQLVPSIRLRPSLGSHLVLSGDTALIGASSVNIAVPGERNRFVFLLPQLTPRSPDLGLREAVRRVSVRRLDDDGAVAKHVVFVGVAQDDRLAVLELVVHAQRGHANRRIGEHRRPLGFLHDPRGGGERVRVRCVIAVVMRQA